MALTIPTIWYGAELASPRSESGFSAFASKFSSRDSAVEGAHMRERLRSRGRANRLVVVDTTARQLAATNFVMGWTLWADASWQLPTSHRVNARL